MNIQERTENQFTLDIAYALRCLTEDKENLSRLETIYKYTAQLVNDLEEKGWSAWASLIQSGLEIKIEAKYLCQFKRIWKVENGPDALLTFFHTANQLENAKRFVADAEKYLYERRQALEDYKTKIALGRLDFAQVWDRDHKFDLGDQIELFTNS